MLETDTKESVERITDSLALTTRKTGRRTTSRRQTQAPEDAADPMEQLKVRIVHLLGSMGGAGAAALVAPPPTSTPPWLAWDTRTHLVYSLPLRDARLDVVLDQLLPRVVALTRDASHRRLKVRNKELTR